MEIISQYLEITTFIITILGVPVALYIYKQEQNSQREEREYGTYDALDDKYIDLQQLCLEHPKLDVFDSPFDEPNRLSKEEEKQEEAILLIRISIFERAFLMYKRENSTAKKDQWNGWEIEIDEWLSRNNFNLIWNTHKKYYDQAFVQYFSNTERAANDQRVA